MLVKRFGKARPAFSLRGGSIETLIRIIDREGGFTIIPELAVNELNHQQKQNIVSFEGNKPLRQVSLCYSRHFTKEKLLKLLAIAIKNSIPQEMTDPNRGEVVVWK